MNKITALFTALTICLCLCACTAAQLESSSEEPSQALTWQEQYDLGVRYLSEGNYQEAIIAFAAAIEIDPKRAPAYVGRGDAYVLSGEAEDNLAVAITDYEEAIKLDETSAEAYLGLANVYIRQGNYEKALEILQQGVDTVGQTQDILDAIAVLNIDAKGIYGQTEFTHRSSYYDFEDMTVEQKKLIEQAVSAAVNQNSVELFSVYSIEQGNSNPFSLGNGEIYTIWDGFKIMFSPNLESVTIEIRPENGIGYYAYIEPSHLATDGDYEIVWSSCRCADWQWNGSIIIQIFTASENAELNLYGEISGQMEDSLREGIFTNNFYKYNSHYDDLYQNGVHLEHNGVQVEYPQVGSIGFFEYAGAKDLWINALYW